MQLRELIAMGYRQHRDTGFGGLVYLFATLLLDGVFLYYAYQIWRNYSDALAKRTFAYSILYLSLLFAALLVDHYFNVPLSMLYVWLG